jgi:hypothetical protein
MERCVRLRTEEAGSIELFWLHRRVTGAMHRFFRLANGWSRTVSISLLKDKYE